MIIVMLLRLMVRRVGEHASVRARKSYRTKRRGAFAEKKLVRDEFCAP